ncbi:MAG: ComEC/Rec2 family competence protein, partial [Arenimonas sp.]
MQRSLFFFFLGGFVAGSIAGEFFVLPMGAGAAVLSLVLPLLAKSRTRIVGMVLLGCVLAVIRWSTVTTAYHSGVLKYQDETIQITGTIIDEPEMIDEAQRIIISQLSIGEKLFSGKVQVKLRSWPRYEVGQRVDVSCQISAFPLVSQRRQWSHSVRAFCRQGKVLLVATGHGWRVQLAYIRHWAIRTIHTNFSEPQSSLMAGIVLGTDEGMSDALRQEFRRTGTTHIIALSGFNVTIIITVVMGLAVRLIGRRRAWMPALFLVL